VAISWIGFELPRRKGAGRKIAYAILLLAHASWLAREIAFCKFARCAAQGIAAESPQDLRWQIRGLGAESPVFCGLGICGANSQTAKNAPQKI
jgi:hypothetical protein